jgi:hypothetical protein
MVAGLIGALLPQRVVLSVAPLSEIMFITAITLAIAFLVQWFSAGRRKDILLSATLFAVASSVRYEGWVFAVLFAALAIFKWLRPMDGRKLLFADARDPILIAISFMALWVTLYFIQHGRPFGFVAETAARYTLVSGDTFERSLLHNPLAQFAIQNVWTLNILGLLSLRLFMRQNVHSRTLVVLPALALLVVSAIAFWGKGMPSHGVWRIPSVWSVLLVPFTAQWFTARLSSLDSSAKLRTAVPACLLVAVVALCVKGTYTMTEHSAFSRDDLAAGRYVQAQLSADTPGNPDKVLIESGIWSYVNVMIASQCPEQFLFNTGYDPVTPEEPLLNPDEPFDEGMFKRMNVGLLVFRRDDYRDYLDARRVIKRLEDFGPWTIYAVNPLALAFDPGEGGGRTQDFLQKHQLPDLSGARQDVPGRYPPQ